MRNFTTIMVAFLLQIGNTNAQLKLNWKLSLVPGSNINYGSYDCVKKVASDNNGNLIVCCTKGHQQSKGFTLIKINKNGLVEWQNDYLTNDSVLVRKIDYSGYGFSEDSILISDYAGNIYLGFYNITNSEHQSIKFDPYGNIVWQINLPVEVNECRINAAGELIYLYSASNFPAVVKVNSSGIVSYYVDSTYFQWPAHFVSLWVDEDDSVHFLDNYNSYLIKWNLSSPQPSTHLINYNATVGSSGTLETRNFKYMLPFSGNLSTVYYFDKNYVNFNLDIGQRSIHLNSANLNPLSREVFYQSKTYDTLKVFRIDSSGYETILFNNPFNVDSSINPIYFAELQNFLNYHLPEKFFISSGLPLLKEFENYLFDSNGIFINKVIAPLASFEKTFDVSAYDHVSHINNANGYTFFSRLSSNSGFVALGFLIGTQSNVLGRLYVDANNNCVWDSTEQTLKNHLVYAAGTNFATVTDTNGIYEFTLPAGSYTIGLNNPTMFTNICGANYNISLSVGQIINNLDFPVNYDPNYVDLSTTVSGGNAISASGSYVFVVHVSNKSFATKQCDLEVNVDSIFFNINPTATPSSVNGNTFVWNNMMLNAGQDSVIYFSCNHPANIPAGTPFSIVSTVNSLSGTDAQPWDNVSVLNRHFQASLDPNVKSVYPDGAINQNDTLLHYTVQFQNTGNYLAYTVVVIDTLDASLDITSLKFGYASHPFNYAILDGNVLKIEFPQILLADSDSNEPESHGEVNYFISPKKNLANGTQIQNRAHIYFDFNTPVATNQTVNLFNFNSISEIGNNGIEIYPNPASKVVEIIDLNRDAIQVKLIDRIGKEIFSKKTSGIKTELNVSTITDGFYILQIETTKGLINKKLVIKR